MTSLQPTTGIGWPAATPHEEARAPTPGEEARAPRGSGLGWPSSLAERPDVTETCGPVSRETSDASRTESTPPSGVSRETALDSEAVEAQAPRPGPAEAPLARRLAQERLRRAAAGAADLPVPAQTRVLTVANQKGGVGKTTTTVNLAAALAQRGARVLVVDMDPQANASTALGVPHHTEVAGIYDVVVEGAPLRDVVQPCSSVPGLTCAPATIDLAGAEIELVTLEARESRLQRALASYLEERDPAERPDYVFMDCPPSLGLLTVNAFVAAREVFIPIQCEYYALEGLTQLLRNVDLVTAHLNPALRVGHILLTMYDGRTRLSAQVAQEVRDHFAEVVLRTTIPRSVRISEAPSHGETVMTYDPSSTGALCYLEAAAEVAAAGTGAAGGAAPADEDRGAMTAAQR